VLGFIFGSDISITGHKLDYYLHTCSKTLQNKTDLLFQASNFDDSASDSGVIVRSLLEDPDHSFLCQLLGDGQALENQISSKIQKPMPEMECEFSNVFVKFQCSD